MGGRGGSSGLKTEKVNVSPLTVFKENARQLNEALVEGRAKQASVVEFTDATGTKFKRYWNGATYTDRASSLYEKEFHGVYKKTFKKPSDWK